MYNPTFLQVDAHKTFATLLETLETFPLEIAAQLSTPSLDSKLIECRKGSEGLNLELNAISLFQANKYPQLTYPCNFDTKNKDSDLSSFAQVKLRNAQDGAKYSGFLLEGEMARNYGSNVLVYVVFRGNFEC
jgi:hypothetical protein